MSKKEEYNQKVKTYLEFHPKFISSYKCLTFFAELYNLSGRQMDEIEGNIENEFDEISDLGQLSYEFIKNYALGVIEHE